MNWQTERFKPCILLNVEKVLGLELAIGDQFECLQYGLELEGYLGVKLKIKPYAFYSLCELKGGATMRVRVYKGSPHIVE